MPETLSLRNRVRRWLDGPSTPRPPLIIHDVLVGAPPEANVKSATDPKRRQKPIVMPFEHRQYRAGFIEPEYNLIEIQQAGDTESYLRLSFDKHEELILKNQWRIVSKNPRVLQHVYRRLTEISWGQDQPMEEIIEAGIEDLVELSNVFYVIARRESGLDTKYQTKFGRSVYPISGIFSPNAGNMKPFVELNKKGVREIKEWWQMMGGRIRKKFDPEDVVHIAFRRRKGHIFGTPYVVPVLDDILALRRIEELVEILVNKHAFPFFHYRVGTDQDPAKEFDNNTSEIDDVKAQISQMPFEGGLVTSHRHEIVVLGTGKSSVIDASPYLKYYEARVLSGLNLSGIDIGRGETANRATAQTMSKGLSDRCTRLQLKFATQFTFHILDELVRELGEQPVPENRAYLLFPTIDMEERRATENHALALYQGGLITETEARTELGRDEISQAQRKDMHFKRLDEPLTIIKAVDEPYTKEAKAGLGSKTATANREQPQNQSKKLASKPKVAANDALELGRELWDSIDQSTVLHLNGREKAISFMFTEALKRVEGWLSDGIKQYMDEHNPPKDMYVGANIKDAFVFDILTPATHSLRVNLAALDHVSTSEQALQRFQTLGVAAEQFFQLVAGQAVLYGYAKAAQLDKKKSVRWAVTDSCCASCLKKAADPIRIHKFKYGELHHDPTCISGFKVAD